MDVQSQRVDGKWLAARARTNRIRARRNRVHVTWTLFLVGWTGIHATTDGVQRTGDGADVGRDGGRAEGIGCGRGGRRGVEVRRPEAGGSAAAPQLAQWRLIRRGIRPKMPRGGK